ncbi:hypothetical protein V7182_24645 [Neobacillus drentensis]
MIDKEKKDKPQTNYVQHFSEGESMTAVGAFKNFYWIKSPNK